MLCVSWPTSSGPSSKLLYLIHHQTPSYPTYPHHPPFSLPIDRYSTQHIHPCKARNNPPTQPTRREFSTVLSSSPQALSSGTSIHSPAASHPVNKRILVALHHDPCRIRRANRHRQAIALARVAHLRTIAWLVAMSPSPAATLLPHPGRSRWHKLLRCYPPWRSSTFQHSILRSATLWYLGKQATGDTFVPSKPPLQAPGLLSLCAFLPSFLACAALRRLGRFSCQVSHSGQKLAETGRKRRTCRNRVMYVPHRSDSKKACLLPRFVELITRYGLNCEGHWCRYTNAEKGQRRVSLAPSCCAVVLDYKVLATN